MDFESADYLVVARGKRMVARMAESRAVKLESKVNSLVGSLVLQLVG